MNDAQSIVDYCNERFVGWTIKRFGACKKGYMWLTLKKGKQEKAAWLINNSEGDYVEFIEEGER